MATAMETQLSMLWRTLLLSKVLLVGSPLSTLPFHRNKCLIRIVLPCRIYSPVANLC